MTPSWQNCSPSSTKTICDSPAQGVLLHVLPGFYGPSALIFGSLDHADRGVGFDQGDPTFYNGAIVFGPVGGEVGDRG